jgi:hypothetical protein
MPGKKRLKNFNVNIREEDGKQRHFGSLRIINNVF